MNTNKLVNQVLEIYKQDLQNGLTDIVDSDYILFLCDDISTAEGLTEKEHQEFCEAAYIAHEEYKESLLPKRNQLMLKRIRVDRKLGIITEGTYFELETILQTNNDNMINEIESTTSPEHFEDLLVNALRELLK